MNNLKILVTGCAGLIGANFSRYLLNKNYEVIGIDDLSGGYIEYIDKRAKFYEFNLLDLKNLDKIFKTEKTDYVYHFAAYAAEGLSPYIRNFNYSNNILCSANIINCCIKYDVKKIIFTSSMAVYGELESPYNEEQVPLPEDPYGIAKYAIELDLRQAYKHFGLKYTIIRPHNAHGIYQNIWDKYRNVLGIWIRQALNNESLTVYGDGLQVRAFSDVIYFYEPLEKVMYGFDGEIFNLGSDKYHTISQAVELLQYIVSKNGHEVRIEYLEPRYVVKNAYCAHTKAIKLLNFNDNTDIEELITQMYNWAKLEKPREVKQMEYELEKNIYAYWK
jgi:UDP-glucose 4-epimerase